MRREYMPYYVSRAVLSAAFALLVFRVTWQAALFAILVFGLFILYLHSGWFRVDLANPLFPLRRDDRGTTIQRKSLISAIVVGLLTYLVLSQAATALGLSFANGALGLSAGILTYFISQFVSFLRT